MILAAARVAPEKADFRPALPMRFLSGVSVMHMENLSYGEQLRHPNWQRKRLEALNAAGFECANCGNKDGMLHVHHRQYFKGRRAWEYELAELDVLCENCHRDEHGRWDGLKKLLSEVGSLDLYALCAGFHHHSDWVDQDNLAYARKSNPSVYAAGLTAWIAYHLDIDQMDKVANFAADLLSENAEPRMVYKFNSSEVFGRGDK